MPDLQKEFEIKIGENEPLIYKVCSMYAFTEADREDLFQDIVIQLWKSYPKFKGESKFSTWLYRVALNTAITKIKKEKRSVALEPLAQHHEKKTENLQSEHKEEEDIKFLYKAIESLSDINKAIIMLYLEDRSYEEMEEIMGISQGTLRVKMNRIKEQLRSMIK